MSFSRFPIRFSGPPSPARREFFVTVAQSVGRLAGGTALLSGFLWLRGGRNASAAARGSLGLVRPPGSRDEMEFSAYCTRCTRCADACEAQCIRFVGPEGGSLAGTPYIMPAEKGCTLCLACADACPTTAIEKLEDRTEAAMGVAVVDKRVCVSHNGTGVCGACHTICPLRNRAITQNFRNAPEVDPEHCTGCGLCEEVCIVRDRRAIRVQSPRTGNWIDRLKAVSS
jgi:ferredoxin-type protein NapG